MNGKIRWITKTAVLLAVLICLQWAGSFVPGQLIRQLLTGSFVNCVLAVTVLLVGMGGGIAVALVSPVCAYLLGIAPNLITVVPIMLANVCYVALLRLLGGKVRWKQVAALAVAAAVKFAVLYVLVVHLICGVAADALLGRKLGDVVVLAPPMLKILPTMFAWPQLVTAMIGGGIALGILPVLKKALHR